MYLQIAQRSPRWIAAMNCVSTIVSTSTLPTINPIDRWRSAKGRNRYVHDLWIHQTIIENKVIADSNVARRTRGPKVVNEQARRRKLALFKDVPTKADPDL